MRAAWTHSLIKHPASCLIKLPPPRLSSLALHRRPRVTYQHHKLTTFTTPLSTRSHAPVKHAVDPLTALLALSVAAAASYFLGDYIYPSSDQQKDQPAAPEKPPVAQKAHARDFASEVAHLKLVELTPEDYAYYSMAPLPVLEAPQDRVGNLTPEKEARLKEFWQKLSEIIGVLEPSPALAHTTTAASQEAASPAASRKGSWFGGLRSPKSDAASPTAEADKFGLGKEYEKALASLSKDELRAAFWESVKHDDPDVIVLRYLRARKWEVQAALVMFIAAIKWRAIDFKIEEHVMQKGELGFLKAEKESSGADAKLGADFITQLRLGKSVLHGVDKAGRPITTVRVRLHKPGAESHEALERYTVYKIETGRYFLNPPVETATIIFDLTNFGLSNMDYVPVKFIIKCFEANYPETLGSVIIYKAPWVFQSIWKLIKGWLDPVVAGKIDFAANVTELEKHIARDQIPKELDGDEQWEYKYTEPEPNQDERLLDHTTRDKIRAERKELTDEYERQTVAWIKGTDDTAGAGAAQKRRDIREQLRVNYWKLDPYVRARSLYDRQGLIPEGGPKTGSGLAAGAPAPAAGVESVTAGVEKLNVEQAPAGTAQ